MDRPGVQGGPAKRAQHPVPAGRPGAGPPYLAPENCRRRCGGGSTRAPRGTDHPGPRSTLPAGCCVDTRRLVWRNPCRYPRSGQGYGLPCARRGTGRLFQGSFAGVRPPSPGEVGGVVLCGTYDEQYIEMFRSEQVPLDQWIFQIFVSPNFMSTRIVSLSRCTIVSFIASTIVALRGSRSVR